jgi:hypothetical protein
MTTRYSVSKTLNNAGVQVANFRYQPSFCYDVDPLLGSTAMPGFTEWAAIYRYYRLRSSRISVMFANNEAFNVLVYVCPLNYDPTANISPNVFLLSSMLCQKTIIGPLTGMNTHTITHAASTDVIGGVRDLGILDGYCAATTGGSPANNWYWAVGLNSFSNLVNGISLTVDMECEIEFFELTSPAG